MKSKIVFFYFLVCIAMFAFGCDDPPTTGTPDADTDGDVDGDVDGGTDGDIDESGPITLLGAVEKGPFVLGSSVTVSAIDDQGNPTGEVFNTSTSDDAGNFSVSFDYRGLVELEGNGFYYNEVTSDLSTSAITLRAFHHITSGGEQSAYINIVTHLSHERIRQIVTTDASPAAGCPGVTSADPESRFVEAIAQAECELRSALHIGSGDFDPETSGSSMNILGGDTAANAYLFAVSSVIAQAAIIRAGQDGPVDATLQELLNGLSADLADDGTFTAPNLAAMDQAEAALDVEAVMAGLAARIDSIGSTADVPDLNVIIDSDNDNIANQDDNCVADANPLQEDENGIEDGTGLGDACECGNGILNEREGEQCDDANLEDGDGCQATCLRPQCGDGIYDLEVLHNFNLYGEGCSDECHGEGYDPETCPEQCAPGYCPRNCVYTDSCPSDCVINFNVSTEMCFPVPDGCDPDLGECEIITESLDVGGNISFVDFQDVTNNGNADIVALDTTYNSVVVFEGNGDGTFASSVSSHSCYGPRFATFADLDDDDDLDIALACEAGIGYLVNRGDGTFENRLESVFPGLTEATSVATADIDFDGHIDIVGVGHVEDEGRIALFLYDSSTEGFRDSINITVGVENLDHVALGDVTGNGYPDIVVASSSMNGGVFVYENSGSETPSLLHQLDHLDTWATFVMLENIDDTVQKEILVMGAGDWNIVGINGSSLIDHGRFGAIGSEESLIPNFARLINNNSDVLYLDWQAQIHQISLDGGGIGQDFVGYGPFGYTDIDGDDAPDFAVINAENPEEILVVIQNP